MNFKSLVIYLGSGGKAPDIYKNAAQNLGHYLAAQKIRTVYGGMSAGTMGILADSALSKGGDVLGVIPTSIRDADFVHHGLLAQDSMIVTEGMWERKKIMVDESDAAIALPGGYGTLDEILEFLYWGVKGFHNKPIGLLDINGYWEPFTAFIDDVTQNGDLIPDVSQFLFIDKTIEGLLEKMTTFNDRQQEKPLSSHKTDISAIEESNLEPTQNPVIIEDTKIENLYRLANGYCLFSFYFAFLLLRQHMILHHILLLRLLP